MNSDDKLKVKGMMVIEVLGRPPEYLTETLQNLIKTMGEEKGVSVREKKLVEPIPLKEKPDFFSSFAEIEVETENVLDFSLLMFKYMPAHVEIISPQNLNLSHSGFNDILNELTRRLHGYEELMRITQTEKIILENQLKTILGEQSEMIEAQKGKSLSNSKKAKKPRLKKMKKEIIEDIEEGGVPEKVAEMEEDIAEEIEEENDN
jgi:hypothetical protein